MSISKIKLFASSLIWNSEMGYNLKLNIEQNGFAKWSISEVCKSSNTDLKRSPNDSPYRFRVKELKMVETDSFNHIEGSVLTEQVIRDVAIATRRTNITGVLEVESDVTFRAFGSDNIISNFELVIRAGNGGSEGVVASNYFSDDSHLLVFQIFVSEERFDEIKSAIKTGAIDIIQVTVSDVEGFYSAVTPDISDDVKILNSNHKLNRPKDCDIEPPVIGKVGKLDFYMSYKVNLHQQESRTQGGDEAITEDAIEKLIKNTESLISEASSQRNEMISTLLQIKTIALIIMLTVIFTSIWLSV